MSLFKRDLISSDFKKSQIIVDGTSNSFFQNRSIYLLTENKYFKKKHRSKLKSVVDADCKAYAFRSCDENGYHRLGIWISADTGNVQNTISLLAHEIYHIVDYILDDSSEQQIRGLEIPAYIMQDLMFNITKMFKNKRLS